MHSIFELPFAELLVLFSSDGSYPNDEGSSQEVTQSLFVGESQNRGTIGGQNKYWGLGGVDEKMRTLPRNRWGKGQHREVQTKRRFFFGITGKRWIRFDKLKLTAWSRRTKRAGFLWIYCNILWEEFKILSFITPHRLLISSIFMWGICKVLLLLCFHWKQLCIIKNIFFFIFLFFLRGGFSCNIILDKDIYVRSTVQLNDPFRGSLQFASVVLLLYRHIVQ